MGPEEGVDRVRHMSQQDEECFPNLRKENYCVTGEKDVKCNCISYAVGITNKRWWPPVDGDQAEGTEWPIGKEEETLDVFVEAFGTRSFVLCGDGELEKGYEKIAIYSHGETACPTHAARQITSSGKWASKLGDSESIRHDLLADLEGDEPAYGKVYRFMKRPISDVFSPECLTEKVTASNINVQPSE